MAPFKYKSLGADEIRIIRFEESKHAASTISVKIEHVKRLKVKSSTPEGQGGAHIFSRYRGCELTLLQGYQLTTHSPTHGVQETGIV